jgi:hypothetical protein
MGIEITALGSGSTWLSQDIEHDRELARQDWERCCIALADASHASSSWTR